MKVQYIASACVVLEHEGIRVLCDPWLTEGIFFGSWYHYPPLSFAAEDFNSVDYIYVSHIHHDHMDPATMERLSKEIPVLIHDYEDKFLLRYLQKTGFKTVHEIGQGSAFALGDDFKIEIIAGDNCDPAICQRYFGCGVPQPYSKTLQIDSLAVFQGDGKTVVNSNDCPYDLALSACLDLKKRFGSIDFLLVGYSSGSAYPHCFENLNREEQNKASQMVCDKMFGQAMGFINMLKPKHFLPFAGQYTLGGKNAALNQTKALREMEELPEIFETLLRENKSSAELVLLNQGESFDIDSGKASSPFAPPNPEDRRLFIDEVLAGLPFPYETEPPTDAAELEPLIQQGYKRMLTHQQRHNNYRSDWSVYLDLAENAELFAIPFDESGVGRTPRGREKAPFLRIKVDARLMKMILQRRAHWNNVELGCHFRFHRQPDTYERAIHWLLCYLHV